MVSTWVVRKPPLVEEQFAEDMIPPEFEERVSKQGMVLRGWAPQLRILAHSSVGGFLTHCGWSSVIESLGLGKPLILFPGGSADLGLIARLMHWNKIGFEVERNDVDGSFKSDLVAACIKRVMVDPEGEQLRANALAMKEIFGNVELSNKCLDDLKHLHQQNTMDRTKKLHIAMFPWLAYGHTMPFLEVSKFLAQKGHRISYISTPKNISRLPKLPPLLSSNITFVEFSLPQVDGLPPGVESTAEVPIENVPYLKNAYDKLQGPLTEFLKNSNVNWLIHDFEPYWLPGVAAPLGINLVLFCLFNATALAFMGPPSALLGEFRKRPEEFTVVPEWIDYPCNVALKHHEIVNHIKCMDDVSDFQRMGLLIQGSQFVTTRACFEFEPDEIKLLIKLYQKPVVPVGLLPPSLPSNEDKRDDKWEATKSWLDSKGEKSVFYIALGSEVSLSEESMRQLAFGIEKSNLPFIWAVRKRPMGEGLIDNIIPPGFEERVSNRGLVLRDWAPQLRILAHSSVGGFLTHCGWSSIIEALKFGRALIVFSGASADQGLNARLLHGRKVGIEIERNEMDGSFTSDLVAKTIRQVLVEPEGEAIRANAWAMKEIFDNEELSNNYLDGFTRFIEEFAPNSACHTQIYISFVVFSLPQIQGLPAEVESISELPIDQIPSLKKAYDKLQDPLTEFLKNSNVNWIIHDFAPYWLPRVATLLGINLVFFSTFNATSFVSMGPPSALLGDLQQRPEDFKAVPENLCNIAMKLHETVNSTNSAWMMYLISNGWDY
ncbi:hypothetical protein Gotur_016998 [Gossypium turneri]